MMYIILLIYFVNIVSGDDSNEAKYIDLLPEKEKEYFLETVARRIFDNIKHKNVIPEKDEHTKLIEKFLKEESLNLRRVSQNNSEDSDSKGDVVDEDTDALDLTREGKRNKRNSLKENKNSDIVRVQGASKESKTANFNELSKELGVSDTEDIEVKHTNNKHAEVDNEEIDTESNIEEIKNKITVADSTSEKISSVWDYDNNKQKGGKPTKLYSTTLKHEDIRDTTEETSESNETAKTTELSYSLNEIRNASNTKNGNFEHINDSSDYHAEQRFVAITVKTSLTTSPEVKFTDPTSEKDNVNNVFNGSVTIADIKPLETEEKNITFVHAITNSPDTKVTETTSELLETNETRKSYDKLASHFDTDKITLEDQQDERGNKGNKALIDDKTLATKTDEVAYHVNLDDNYFGNESTAAAVAKNNDTSNNDLVSPRKDNDKKENTMNLVTERGYKGKGSNDTLVSGAGNSTEKIKNFTNDLITTSKENYEKVTEKENSMNSGTESGNNTDTIRLSDTIVSGVGNINEKIISSSNDLITTSNGNYEKVIEKEKSVNSVPESGNKDMGSSDTTVSGAGNRNEKIMSSSNDLITTSEEKYEKVTENENNINSVTESGNNDIGSSGTIVIGAGNSKETNIKVIKNSKDYIKVKHSIKETTVDDYNGTTVDNIMKNDSDVIARRDPDKTTTLISDNKGIIIENTKENTENSSYGIINGLNAKKSVNNNKMKSSSETIMKTSIETSTVLEEIEMQNNTKTIPELHRNKTETKYEEPVTECKNITIRFDALVEENKNNRTESGSHKDIAIENNESTTSADHIETTTVKIETLTVPAEINKSETDEKEYKIREDARPYSNLISKTLTAKTDHEPVKVFSLDGKKVGENLEKMEQISANFVNDMIKVIKSSFSGKPNEDLKTLRADDNPKPKEYKVYKNPNNQPLDEKYDAKDEKVIEENPYYVPVYNYGPEHAYYNPKNRLGPNADDEDIKIIKNDDNNIESIAHDYDSIVKDGYNENDYLKNEYQNYQGSNNNDFRNDDDYDEAYNKEREFIDRMGNDRGNILTSNKNIRGRDTENTQKLKKIEYMKNLVKIYKNRNSKNRNKERSFSRYKLNLPIVVNYPKYSDIILNSHDYLDVDYRYPTWNKPKHSRSSKHKILRLKKNKKPKHMNPAKDSNSDQEDVEVTKPDKKFDDDSDEFLDETQNKVTEKHYKIIYDDDYEDHAKKPLENHYGKPNSINLFKSEEYVWETQYTKKKRNEKKTDDQKSVGAKNQIRKIREMMYSAANMGFIKPKEVEKYNYNGLKDFVNDVPKMCDDEDPSCIEPYILINNNHIHNRKQTNSGKLFSRILRNHLIGRMNYATEVGDNYVPKVSARTNQKEKKYPLGGIDPNDITWMENLSDLSKKQKDGTKFCRYCSGSGCHLCVCGPHFVFCKMAYDEDNELDTTPHNSRETTEPTQIVEEITEHTHDKHDNTTTSWSWDTVKNISMLPSHLDPILKMKKKDEEKLRFKKRRPIFRSRDNKLLQRNSLRDVDKSSEDNDIDPSISKPNIIKLNSGDDLKNLHHHEDEDEDEDEDEKQTTDANPLISKNTSISIKKMDTIKSIMEIVPNDVDILLKVVDMFENASDEDDTKKDETKCLRSVEPLDLESYVTVLEDMVSNEAKGLTQYDWMGTSIDIQAAIFRLKEMIEIVKNNEVLDHLDFQLLKYFTFLHKFSTKRQNDLRMVLPKPKYKYNKTRSEKGIYSRLWLKRRLKKFAFEVSGTDLFYFNEFLEDLQFYLYDLHTALTQIAIITSYNNQHWFKNLSELYLDNSRKNILELLLHFTTIRLLDLVENSAQTGLQDGFLQYIMNNEKEIEKSKNELVLILKIIEELKQ